MRPQGTPVARLFHFSRRVTGGTLMLLAALACAPTPARSQALAAPAPAPGPAESPQALPYEVPAGTAFESHILWWDKAKNEARFIPQQVWDRTPLDELPISDRDMEMLRYRLSDGAIEPSPFLTLLLRRAPWLDRRVWLAQQRALGVEPRACEQPIEEAGARRPPVRAPRPLHELIRVNEASFVGEVVAVVPGASPTGFPQEAVYLRVGEVLRDERQRVRPGAILVRVRSTGRVNIEGQELCSERPFNVEATHLGDTVLLGGRLEEHGAGLLFPQFELRVVDGQILPGSTAPTTDTLPKALDQLRAECGGNPPGALP